MGKLDWLVVQGHLPHRDRGVLEGARRDRQGHQDRGVLPPAAPAAEKDGSLTNTMRLIQWHEKAVNPPGDVTSDAEFFVSLAKRLQKMYAGSKKERDRGFLAASFTYGDNPKEPEHGAGAEGGQRLRHRGDHRQGRQGGLQEGPGAATPSPT